MKEGPSGVNTRPEVRSWEGKYPDTQKSGRRKGRERERNRREGREKRGGGDGQSWDVTSYHAPHLIIITLMMVKRNVGV